jgi:hypothetical protein
VRRPILIVVCSLLALALGAAVGYWLWHPKGARPDDASLVYQVREIAKLETLEVSLYKKVTYAPEQDGQKSDTLWGEVISWARHTFRTPYGRAIVFADVTLAYDLEQVEAESFDVQGDRIHVKLPPLTARVSLKPSETEIIGSNLNSAETAKLFALAKEAFEAEVLQNAALQARARKSAETSIRALLLGLGYREVTFENGARPLELR